MRVFNFLAVLILASSSASAEVAIKICGGSESTVECPETPEAPPGLPAVGASPPPMGLPVDSLGVCSNETGSWKCENVPMKVSEGGYLTSQKPEGWADAETAPSNTGLGIKLTAASPPYQSVQGAAGADTMSLSIGLGEQVCADLGRSVDHWGNLASGAYGSYYAGVYCTGNIYRGLGVPTPGGCPTGYKVSGSGCVLEEGATYGYAKWPSDGKCTGMRSGDTFVQASRDPDCTQPGTGSIPLPAGCTQTAPNSISCTGANGSKGKLDLGTPAGGTGRGKLTNYTPNSDGKTSEKQQVTVGAPSSQPANGSFPGGTMGKTDGYSEGTVNGVGETVGDGAATDGNGDDKLDTAGLAKDATLQGIGNSLGEKLDGVKDALEGTGELAAPELNEGDAPEFSESWQGMIDKIQAGPLGALSTFSVAEGDPTCPTYEIPLGFASSSITMSSHCDIMESIGPTISTVMTAVWAFLGVWILFSA